MVVLETHGVSRSFGKLVALNGVSFQVEEAEIFGIAGPNGAGKSTLFNVIAGLYPPSAGRVFFRGQDITGLSPHQVCQRGIARTFQIPATFQSLTVYDNIRVGATFGSPHRRRVADVVEFLGLADKAGARARNLDLYTTKLVMLGAALATGCSFLMLDEPMAGFSMVEIDNFLGVVRAINREWGVTVLIIEHLLDVLVGLAGRILILHDGQVLYVGPSDKVTQDRRVVEVYLGRTKEKQPCSR